MCPETPETLPTCATCPIMSAWWGVCMRCRHPADSSNGEFTSRFRKSLGYLTGPDTSAHGELVGRSSLVEIVPSNNDLNCTRNCVRAGFWSRLFKQVTERLTGRSRVNGRLHSPYRS